MAKTSPWVYWNVIIGRTKLTPEIDSELDATYDRYMINRFLLHDPRLIKFLTIHPNNDSIPNRIHFELVREFYKSTIGNKTIYIEYVKKDPIEADIALLQDYYQINRHEAARYLEMISDEDLDTLHEHYRLINLNETNKKSKKR